MALNAAMRREKVAISCGVTILSLKAGFLFTETQKARESVRFSNVDGQAFVASHRHWRYCCTATESEQPF
jgi:hypothetical protein